MQNCSLIFCFSLTLSFSQTKSMCKYTYSYFFPLKKKGSNINSVMFIFTSPSPDISFYSSFSLQFLLATLSITKKSLELQPSGRKEVNTRKEQTLWRLQDKLSTVNSFLQRSQIHDRLNRDLPEPQCLNEISSQV